MSNDKTDKLKQLNEQLKAYADELETVEKINNTIEEIHTKYIAKNPNSVNTTKGFDKKEFYQLFFSVILGATGAFMINIFIVNYLTDCTNIQNWIFLGKTLVYLIVSSGVVIFLSYKIPEWRRKKYLSK
jgi:hypothetical protein